MEYFSLSSPWTSPIHIYLVSPQGQGHHNMHSETITVSPYALTNPVNLLEYPEKTHDFWQSVLHIYSFRMRNGFEWGGEVCTENRTHDLNTSPWKKRHYLTIEVLQTLAVLMLKMASNKRGRQMNFLLSNNLILIFSSLTFNNQMSINCLKPNHTEHFVELKLIFISQRY